MPRNYKTPAYSKRHYEALASVMNKVFINLPNEAGKHAVFNDVMFHLLPELKFNGSRFDAARFRAACEKPRST